MPSKINLKTKKGFRGSSVLKRLRKTPSRNFSKPTKPPLKPPTLECFSPQFQIYTIKIYCANKKMGGYKEKATRTEETPRKNLD
jgi:hypothetical protein